MDLILNIARSWNISLKKTQPRSLIGGIRTLVQIIDSSSAVGFIFLALLIFGSVDGLPYLSSVTIIALENMLQ